MLRGEAVELTSGRSPDQLGRKEEELDKGVLQRLGSVLQYASRKRAEQFHRCLV